MLNRRTAIQSTIAAITIPFFGKTKQQNFSKESCLIRDILDYNKIEPSLFYIRGNEKWFTLWINGVCNILPHDIFKSSSKMDIVIKEIRILYPLSNIFSVYVHDDNCAISKQSYLNEIKFDMSDGKSYFSYFRNDFNKTKKTIVNKSTKIEEKDSYKFDIETYEVKFDGKTTQMIPINLN